MVVTHGVHRFILEPSGDCMDGISRDVEQAAPVHLRTQSREELLGQEGAGLVVRAEDNHGPLRPGVVLVLQCHVVFVSFPT
mgnify:CR=1 FL=1